MTRIEWSNPAFLRTLSACQIHTKAYLCVCVCVSWILVYNIFSVALWDFTIEIPHRKHILFHIFHPPLFLSSLSLLVSTSFIFPSALSVCPSILFFPLPQPAVESSQINQFRFSGQTSGVARNWPFFSICVSVRKHLCLLHTNQREAVRADWLSASELLLLSGVAVPPASY